MDIDKLRKTSPNELSQDEKENLSLHLLTQVRVEELTQADKDFLNTPMEHSCMYCGSSYMIQPVIANGNCQQCMMEKGMKYNSNPLTPGSNAASVVIKFLVVAFLIFLFLGLFSETM